MSARRGPGRLLWVEDDPDLGRSLAWSLRREGFAVVHVQTGAEALEHLRHEPLPDVVLLDLTLPDLPGTEICRRIRADPRGRDLGVVMLSGRGDEIDRVVGFELGADDYLVKPVSVRELTLRLHALLRRLRNEPATAQDSVTFGRLRLDVEGLRCWLDGAPLSLTVGEHRLLARLFLRRGRVQTRESLLEALNPGDLEASSLRTIDSAVKRLRARLGPAGAYVETVRGMGYRFVERVEDLEA